MHASEIEEYKRQVSMVQRNVADLEAEKAELDGTWNDKEAQIAELNAALEELEEEKGRDLNALHVQHQEQQRLLFFLRIFSLGKRSWSQRSE